VQFGNDSFLFFGMQLAQPVGPGCFRFYYPLLQQQFQQAKIPLFKNEWYAIFDFNAPAAGPNPNWSYIPEVTLYQPQLYLYINL
jgi:hypothetical protein